MSGMFYKCESLIKLDISNFNTSNVTDMDYIFFGCQNLIDFNFSNINMEKIKEKANMFYDCSSMPYSYLSYFNNKNNS